MKNQVIFCGHDVYRWIVVFSKTSIIGQFDSLSEAKEIYGGIPNVCFRYAAAVRNAHGSIVAKVYGDSLSEVMNKIKDSLNNEGDKENKYITKQKIELVIRKETSEIVRVHRVPLFHIEDALSICQFLNSKAKVDVTCKIEVSYEKI